jgi:hypothetical protein
MDNYTGRTPGSERPRLTRSTIVADPPASHRASSRARAGPGVLLAPRPRHSFVASQESASRSSSAISRADGIYPSSP